MEEGKAQELVEHYKKLLLKKFCPITKDFCREDCTCFEPGMIKDTPAKGWIAQGPWCSHLFICGSLEVNNILQ